MFRRLGLILLVHLAMSASALAQSTLAVVTAQPSGEIATLAQANEIRVRFSEPMVPVGRMPDEVTAPFLSISPSINGTLRWAGPTILVFTPDPKAPLPYATRYDVTIAATATAVSGRKMSGAFTFTFTTPTVRLLSARWYRANGRFDDRAVIVLYFNQPVRAADVAAHATGRYERHDWPRPRVTAEERARMSAADAARFDAKVSAAAAAAASEAPIPLRPAANWDRLRFQPAPSLAVLETVSPPATDGWLRLSLDNRLPAIEGRAMPPAEQTQTIRLDQAHGGTIDGASTPRQPGSALKPFTYALAFEEGASPATVLPDVASYFPTAQDGVLYSPRNYDGQFRGPLLARRALAGSENVPAVALASRIGVPNLLRFLRTAGFSTFNKTAAHYGLGVTLGDAEVRLDELVAAYAAFARGGVTVEPTFVRHPAADPRVGPAMRLVSPRTAFWITDILSDDEARAYAFGRGGSLKFPFAVAAKTGTSQAYRDNWTIGYTREVTVGVWVGNFDRRPLIGSSGITGAGPIFHGVMLAVMRRVNGRVPAAGDSATDAQPERSVRRSICALSGLAAARDCPSTIEEWSAAEAPARRCSWHRPTPAGVVVDWPPEYRAWAAGRPERDRVVRDRAAAAAVEAAPVPKSQPEQPAIRVLSPPDGAVYLIDPTLRREFQTIGLRASAEGAGRVEWRVDDVAIGTVEAHAALDWPLAAGRHVISVRDSRGRRADAIIVVK